jgi:uncharacterized protein YdaT
MSKRVSGVIAAMPWNSDRFPPAMESLPAIVREKAIEIANALLADGCDDGRAIRIAIAQAKRWAVHRWGRLSGSDDREGYR